MVMLRFGILQNVLILLKMATVVGYTVQLTVKDQFFDSPHFAVPSCSVFQMYVSLARQFHHVIDRHFLHKS